ncbi:MAG TPA: carbohydrate porin [Gemmataceae bacterium]|nr:carbohydrate porin [Gemmataceae bacterium]
MLLALALALAGCATTDVLPSAPESAPAPGVARAVLGCPCESPPAASAKADENSEATPKPHRPRTVPQALCAYFRCLCSPDHKREEDREKEKDKNSNNEKAKEKDNGKEGQGGKSVGEGVKDKNGKTEKENGAEKDKENGAEKAKENGAKEKEKEKEPADAWYSAHFQTTVVTQIHNRFNSPYLGPNSLQPGEGDATSLTSTLFLDLRLWEGGELIFNPELAGGRGFSGSSGIAGFPNGEITRAGTPTPTPYFARFYLRETWGLGDEMETVKDGANEIAGQRPVHRLTLNVGKFAATDFADDNDYSHDPRKQFLPWSLIYNGAWDYPANVRGYTYGIALDYNTKWWTLTYAVLAEPSFANGAPLDPHILKANGHVLEWERRWKINEHPGSLRLMAFLNHAHMGNYREALALMPQGPDVTATRAYRLKYGFGLSWDQEVTKDLGVFARLGWADGRTEAWAFTAMDELAELGLALKGRCWCRPNDMVGVAVACGGLASPHRDYLAAGGLDFIIGDGKLRYGPEEIFETYYNYEVRKGINVTLDTQAVNHPAYNRDRGPVWIGSIRVHFEY